jgi:hypothetical protein
MQHGEIRTHPLAPIGRILYYNVCLAKAHTPLLTAVGTIRYPIHTPIPDRVQRHGLANSIPHGVL